MNDKMRRFLNHIHIENVDRFDLDFDLVTRNQFDRNQIDMLIVKKTPWDYSQLEEFQQGLSTLTYPYTLTISYVQKPTIYEAIQLFDDWHRSNYRFPADVKLDAQGDTIVFVFDSEAQQAQYEEEIKNFQDFLSFLSYRFDIEKRVEELEPEGPSVSKKKMEKIEAKAIEVASEAEEEPDDPTYYKDQKEIESEEREEELKQLTNEYLSEMKENLKKLKQDTKKGYSSSWRDNLPYTHYDDLSQITKDSGNVDIVGELFGIDKPKTGRGGKMFLNMGVGYKGTAIDVRAVENEFMPAEAIEQLKNGMYVRLRGYAEADRFTGQVMVTARGYELLPPPALRDDKCEQKRVELHLHSKMSTMDGVSTIGQYCELAKHMGHKAIAITDHGVTQGYPDAQEAAEKNGIKMIYGCELYVVNDELPFALNPKDIPLRKASYVVFDLETTGLSARYDKITEFGAIKFEDGQVVKTLDILINPEMPIPEKIQIKTKITQEMVASKPTIKEVMPQILEFIGDSILVSHNINFDVGFMNEALRVLGQEPLSNPCIDTLSLSRYMFPESRLHSLGSLSRNLGMATYNDEEAHRADYDARILNDVWLAMLNRLTEDNFDLLHSDLAKFKVTTTMYKHMRPYHVVALAKDRQGLRDLYRIVSDSHITYFADVAKTPKTELKELREHLFLGSACFNGDVFDTARTRSKDILRSVISFYDYIEVQPPANYSHLIDIGQVENYEEIQKYIKDIIEVADELHIPVCATGDVHYRDPEDKITRDIFISAQGVGGRWHPLLVRSHIAEAPDQHYRSTKEMLDAFEFLGKDKAFEIVVTNTNAIADQIEELKPVQKELHPPVIENSPEILRSITTEKCKELYGDPIPQFIADRLNKELDGIIGNGYSVTYYIAREIVKRANDAGYIVGSRGSVGSSLAAFMFGITEVNALPPHYRCPHCKHLEFVDDPNVFSGYDLPDKTCPECGEKMVGDGQNIPFETFLGFNGDKIPDIDLNFPSDYQQRAFDSTKDIFGEHNVFRAGTIETVADKTAFGYVRGYFERRYIQEGHTKEEAAEYVNSIPKSKVGYLAAHCVDVRRTTGQHPGGIMVLPKGLSIYDFTPIQYPADDKDSSWYTTHLDYHAIHDALLKLDLLGHVDPLALRLMVELTGIQLKDIPLNDARVISLFSTDKALNRTSNYLKAVTGASGLPEFGTDTANDILLDAKPKSFADLVVIAGLAHGTDVWANNAQDLIRSGQCTIREVIGCRDDIMTYLIKKGIPHQISFKIMEDVRKGKKLKPEYEQIMLANNVPQWYLDSCNKIKYMFPKAHAVAYVTMAVRVGYFKVYHPLEFYAVWFSVRCKAYDIHAMLGGLDAIINRYEEIKRKKNNRVEKVSPKEKDLFAMLKVAIEMAERGFKFSNIDLYKSKATEFVVDKENNALIPPFTVLDGLGENAAQSVVDARNDGPFATKEDLLRRTKLNSTNVEDLSKLGVLDGLGETDQMTLFDFGFDMEE
ncbi:MAG: PolC-type DNA polymerase III [Bacilli bacterium]|nr:PolC-type DNA polymerase III [Bacilli bacterium]